MSSIQSSSLDMPPLRAESRRIAEKAGLEYVEDLCTAVMHRYEVREQAG